ncbi:MAG: Rnf-Nqr domain containing protein [Candidatus Eutrophobiaceae bacterium]
MSSWIAWFGAGSLLHNLALTHCLGLYEVIAGSRRLDIAWLLAAAFCVCIPSALIVNGLVFFLIIEPLGLHPWALLFQALSMLIMLGALHRLAKRIWPQSPELCDALFPVVLLNATLIGAMQITLDSAATGWTLLPWGLGLAAGFGGVIVLMAWLQERLEMRPAPAVLSGLPIELITLAVITMGLSALGGMFE